MKKHIFLLSIFTTLASNSAHADMTGQELQKKKSCITAIENVNTHFVRANDLWLGASGSFNIERRFAMLLEVHGEYRIELFDFAKDFQQKQNSPEAVLAKIRELEREQAALLVTIDRMNIADEVFTASIAGVDEAYATLGDRILNLNDICQSFAEETLKESIDGISTIRSGLKIMEGYVQEAGKKRGDLFLALYHGTKAALFARYAALQALPVADAKRKIDSILLGDQFMNRIQSWWQTTNGRHGLGGGLIGKYLQFFTPLSTMKSDYSAGKSLERELEGQPLETHVLKALRQELSIRLLAIGEQIAELENRGAGGMLALQISTNDKRKTMLQELGDQCETAILGFEGIVTKSGPISDYALTERSYLDVVTRCQKKGW